MAKFKFAVNISTVFREFDIYERFKQAKICGFDYVEIQFPYEYDLEKLNQARIESDVKVAMINSPWELPTSRNPNVFGLMHHSHKFQRSIEKAVMYAKTLECDMIHLIGTNQWPKEDTKSFENIYSFNTTMAGHILNQHGIQAVVEPLCEEVKDPYFPNDYLKTIEIIEHKIKSDNLKLLFDVYHYAMIHQQVEILTDKEEISKDKDESKYGPAPEEFLNKYLNLIGHIQVSQAPCRNEPFEVGAINYSSFFSALMKQEYSKYVGLEYFPTGTSAMSLASFMDAFTKLQEKP